MNQNPFAPPTDSNPPRALEVILYGGLVVGVLDGLYAVVFNGLRGVSPIRVFQFITSGLVGRSAFSGGVTTFLFGILLHFLIAFTVAGIYCGASLLLPMLIRQAVL
jgi:hypothetical protein